MPPIASDDVRRTLLGELWDATRMRLIVEIGRRGSLSAAAEAIGIGQPSASQHLRLLEAAAGQRLVERSGRGSRLTEAGRVVAAKAAQALQLLGSAEEDLAALAGLRTGTIHVGASTAPGVYLLPDTLGCFRREHPGVTIEVEIASSRKILARLIASRVQIAIVGTEDVDERVRLLPFLDDEIVGIAKPGTLPLRKDTLDPELLTRLLLLCREPGSASRALADAALARAGVEPMSRWELGSSEAIKRAAREGLGIAFLSRYAVAEEVERGELESFRLAGAPPLTRRFSVATLGARELTASENGFLSTLTRCCAKSAIYAESCVGAPRQSGGPRPGSSSSKGSRGGVTGRPASRQASKPPITSVARAKPSSRRPAAASADE
jgi:molybdate transport repressor ModE-like protein